MSQRCYYCYDYWQIHDIKLPELALSHVSCAAKVCLYNDANLYELLATNLL